MLIVCSPTAVLLARRKILCPVCTVDEALPVMIEEGSEWEAHARTKAHKRLAAKKADRKQPVDIPGVQGKTDRTRDDIGNADNLTGSLIGLFGT